MNKYCGDSKAIYSLSSNYLSKSRLHHDPSDNEDNFSSTLAFLVGFSTEICHKKCMFNQSLKRNSYMTSKNSSHLQKFVIAYCEWVRVRIREEHERKSHSYDTKRNAPYI